MTIALNVNGIIFNYPETSDESWGNEATNWAQAITNGTLQKKGGNFTLTADVNFGANYGLISTYFKSRNAAANQTGVFQMARTEEVTWRNTDNNGDNTLGVGTEDELLYNGLPIASQLTVANTPTINLDLTANELTADLVENSITNVFINEDAAIHISKLGQSGAEDGYVVMWNDGDWVAAPNTAGPVGASNIDHIFLTDSNEVGFRKNSHKHFLYEDFDSCLPTMLPAVGSSGAKVVVNFANTNWLGGSYNSDGYVGPAGSDPNHPGPQGSEQYHPGVITLAAGQSGPGPQRSWINMGDFNESGYYFPYYVNDIYEIEAVFKVLPPADEFDFNLYLFTFGLSSEVLLADSDNAILFYKDSDDGYYAHALCKVFNDGYGTSNTDESTGYNPDGYWTKYTIRQEVVGQFSFYINDNLTNFITPSIPNNSVLSPFFTIGPSGSDRSAGINIDYFSLTTRDLGGRYETTSGPIGPTGPTGPTGDTGPVGDGYTLYVDGRHLYDANGVQFLMRGVECWWVPNPSTIGWAASRDAEWVDFIAASGANAVRFQQLTTTDPNGSIGGDTYLNRVKNVIDRFHATHHMITYVNNDNMTGIGAGQGADSWFGFSAVRTMLQEPSRIKNIIIDLSTEDGIEINSPEDLATYIAGEKALIQRFRDWGYTCPLSVGAAGPGGRGLRGSLDANAELIAFDRAINADNSLIFNWQAYWYSGGSFYQNANGFSDGIPGCIEAIEEIAAQTDACYHVGLQFGDTKRDGSPQLSGGSSSGFGDSPYREFMEACQDNQVGWQFWEIKDIDASNVNDLYVEQFIDTMDDTFSNGSDYSLVVDLPYVTEASPGVAQNGEIVLTTDPNSIANTSVKATSF